MGPPKSLKAFKRWNIQGKDVLPLLVPGLLRYEKQAEQGNTGAKINVRTANRTLVSRTDIFIIDQLWQGCQKFPPQLWNSRPRKVARSKTSGLENEDGQPRGCSSRDCAQPLSILLVSPFCCVLGFPTWDYCKTGGYTLIVYGQLGDHSLTESISLDIGIEHVDLESSRASRWG